jgi:malonyl-CoA O-methyltransferase
MMSNYYDGIAPGYNTLYGEEQQIKLQSISRLLHNTPINGQSLLDVGCGTGISSDYFVDKFNCTVTGIDPSRELIKQNQSNKSTLVVGSAEELPFSDNQFTVVVSVSAIQNFTDVQAGLDEIKRVGNDLFVLTFMSKENENADEIIAMIESTFDVKEKVTAKNDTVFLAVK